MADTLLTTTMPDPVPSLTGEAPQDAIELAIAYARSGTTRALTTSLSTSDSGTDLIEGLPLSLVSLYARRAKWHARVREVDPGVWAATVAGLEGAYGDGDSAQTALDDLVEAVIGWVTVRRRLRLTIPQLDGLDLNVPAAAGST